MLLNVLKLCLNVDESTFVMAGSKGACLCARPNPNPKQEEPKLQQRPMKFLTLKRIVSVSYSPFESAQKFKNV